MLKYLWFVGVMSVAEPGFDIVMFSVGGFVGWWMFK